MSKKIKVHLVQFASCEAQPLKTADKLQKWLKSFSPEPASLVVFPEMWPSSFGNHEKERQIAENAHCFLWLKRYAKLHRCFMAGSMLEHKQNKSFNSAYLINPNGELSGSYRKIHLFAHWGEHERFAAGEEVMVCPFGSTKLGLAICYDLRFPELFRRLAELGSEVIIVPSAWPSNRLDHFKTLLKARAIENQCFVVGVNKVGPRSPEIRYGGHSIVYGPWGESCGELGPSRGILSLDLDLARLAQIRQDYPFLKSRRLR